MVEKRAGACLQGVRSTSSMLPAQSEKPPLHPPKADFGRAFRETEAAAVRRNPTIPMDG
jgi:hypothetical protein